MSKDEILNILLFALLAGIPSCAGSWLHRRGVLRERYFIWVVLPLSLAIGFFAVSMRTPELETWETRLLATITATALVMIPGLVGIKTEGFGLGRRAREKRKRREE